MDQSDGQRNEDDLHRRDLSRAFLPHLRKAVRFQAEYKLVLADLAGWSQIVRHGAEDNVEQDLEREIDSLLERCSDPARIESEILERDAAEILNTQGAFKPSRYEEDPEQATEIMRRIQQAERDPGSLIPFEAVLAQIRALTEERRRTIWQQSFKNQQQVLHALRWSGFRGPLFEAYWNDEAAWISCSVGAGRTLQSTGFQVGEFSDIQHAVRRILATNDFISRVGIIHSEQARVTLDWIEPSRDSGG